jgi:thiamine kinase-like enzyme
MRLKVNMPDRQHHQEEIRAFLQNHFGSTQWDFSLPGGSGNETYFAQGNGQACFVKLGVQISRYQAMAAMGLTPQVLANGYLTDGTSIIVQPTIEGRRPSRKDLAIHLEQVASIIHRTHHSLEVQRLLPAAASNRYSVLGLEAVRRIQKRWELYRGQVPDVAGFVDESLAYLTRQAQDFQGAGLVASHNDINNYNWLLTPEGRLYLIDLDLMALDDPAADLGAILWWYYPPELRPRFLEIAGYANDETFRFRMQVRMAMHCLSITLPREESFDEFDPASFDEWLTDFRAILAGEENPQGYGD